MGKVWEHGEKWWWIRLNTQPVDFGVYNGIHHFQSKPCGDIWRKSQIDLRCLFTHHGFFEAMGWMHSKCTSRHGGCTSSTSAYESIDGFWAEKIRLHWFKLWGSVVVVIGVRLLADAGRCWQFICEHDEGDVTHNPTLPPNKFNGSADVAPLIPCHVEWGHPFRWKSGQHFWTLAATFDMGHVRISLSLSLQLCKSANSVNLQYYLAKWSRAFVESYNTPRQPNSA